MTAIKRVYQFATGIVFQSWLRSLSAIGFMSMLCFLGKGVPAFAQTFNFETRESSQLLTATQIKAHDGLDTLIVTQDKWNKMLEYGASWQQYLKFKSVHAFVKFKVDYGYQKKITTPYTFRLTYRLYGYPNMSDTNSYVTFTDTLTISYNPDSLGVMQDMQYKKYSNFHKIMVVLTGLYEISDADAPPVPVDISKNSNFSRLNFNVEGSILVQPFQKNVKIGSSTVNVYGAGMSPLTIGATAPVNDYMEVRWNLAGLPLSGVIPVEPAAYELEWTYIDNYKVNAATGAVTEVAASALRYDFKHNSTRVLLDTNYYRIPMIYQKGYVLFRVRMLRPDSVLYKSPVYSPWSLSADTGNVGAANSSSKYKILQAHQHDSLNWQYTVSFAEGGKHKQVLSYYDGLLKNRQSITRFNSRPQMLIATGQFYDYEGRPSLSTLPAPIPSGTFRYQPNLAINSATSLPYRAADFDQIVPLATCPADPVIPRMAATSAAHIYYSPLNPDKAGLQKFVPDAGGYPLVETRYQPGNDARVVKQGGAGDSLQIGYGHTVQNDYVSPAQMALNRLFGLDVGKASFYRKTVSRDPNGQYAFQVIDYTGKTIASALIGEPDTLKHALVLNKDLPDTSSYREDFIAGAIQQRQGNKLNLNKSIFNEAAGNNSAQYVYRFNPFQTFCPSLYLSVQAAFNYAIYDECGDLQVQDDGVLGTTGVMSNGQVVPYTAPAHAFFMKQGKHTLRKELKVNLDEVAKAVDDFMALAPSQNCTKTEQTFIKEAVQARTFPCAEPPLDDCGRRKQQMMRELWPNLDGRDVNGKYGVYTRVGASVVGDGYSIFDIVSPGGGIPPDYRYRSASNYCSYFSFPDTIYKDGRTYTNIAELPVDTFIYIFNDAVAEALLPLHPEYCGLVHCGRDTFADKLSALPDAATAEALGLLYLDDIINADPLYADMQLSYFAGRYPSPYDTLANVWGGGYRLDRQALLDAYCGCSDSLMARVCLDSIFNVEINAGLLINDYVKVRYFKTIVPLYLANRQKYADVVIFSPRETEDACTDCQFMQLELKFPPVFVRPDGVNGNEGNFDDWSNSISPGASTDSDHWRDLLTNEDSVAAAEAQAHQLYDSMQGLLCANGIDHIMQQLVNCVGTAAQLQAVRASLEALCASGEAFLGNYTPAQIRHALVSNGISLDDLCNPYVVSYDALDPYAGLEQGDFNCKSFTFYAGAAAILGSAAILNRLAQPGTSASYTIPGGSNLFGQALIAALVPGSPQTPVTVKATYSSSNQLYTLQFTYSSKRVTLYLNTGGAPAQVFLPGGATVAVTGVSCIRDFPGRSANGYVGRYSFVLGVRRVQAGNTSNYLFTGWADTISMTNPAPLTVNPLEDCVPCTQMSNLYEEFSDTLTAYAVKGTDHPYYPIMLRNFMNHRLGQIFSQGQYERFIESCALADSMELYRYGVPYFMTQVNVTNGNTFLSAFQNQFPNAYAPFMRIENSSGLDAFYFDLNAIPLNQLKTFRDFMQNYSVFVVPKGINTPIDAGPNKMGRLYVSSSSTFNPTSAAASIFPSAAFTFALQSGTYKISFSGSQKSNYKVYYVNAPSGANPAQRSVNIQKLTDYLFDQGIDAYFLPFRQATVDEQYYLPEKQAYLKYVYKFKNLSPAQVLDTLQPVPLKAGVPLYQSQALRYGTPLQPGNIQDLYITGSGAGSGFSRLNLIMTSVKNYFSGGKIIFTDQAEHTIFNNSNGQLIAYRCSDSSYWYRYFGPGDTLYNVFFTLPTYISPSILDDYSYSSIATDAGDNSPFSFSLTLVNSSAPIPEITITGLADFEIASGIKLEDVLLAHPLNKSTATGPDVSDNCERTELKSAIYEGQIAYQRYRDSLREKLYNDFYAYIMDGGVQEQLLSGFGSQQFSYTLYYYDQAGNLMRTVPPAGVYPLPANVLNQVDTARDAGTYPANLIPAHKQSSYYYYNSLNQVVDQVTPDGGRTEYFYDAAGRPVFSQDARQQAAGLMSYTLYDAQGRVEETGQARLACPYFSPYPSTTGYIKPELQCAYYDAVNQLITPFPLQVSNVKGYTQPQIASFVRSFNREDVVLTIYDEAPLAGTDGLPEQENLRQRVASILYYKQLPSGANLYQSYSYGMHFSYDIAGNVRTLSRDYPAWEVYHQRFKRVDYDYDLISGKVNLLSYNRGYPDQYYQRYAYDADNRITAVESSSDGLLWQQDARYDYYQHGPLARLSLGELRVQGLDYAYTIQGWLKSVNGDNMKAADEMGKDGLPGGNGITAKDAYALTLDYFKGDYKPIGTVPVTHTTAPAKSLYNGNIPRSTIGIQPFPTLSTTYTYDQLNRLVRAQYATLQANNSLSPVQDYYNSYAYDPNGNISKLTRKGNVSGGLARLMDSLTYYYDSSGHNNRLLNLTDHAANVAAYGNDIKYFTNKTVQRYGYDATGNVIKDQVSGQDSILWNRYNKVTQVRQEVQHRELDFAYDGAGQRYLKLNRHMDDTSRRETADYYVRDAQGNILATYRSETEYGMGGDWSSWIAALNQDIRNQIGEQAFMDHIMSHYGNNSVFKSYLIDYIIMASQGQLYYMLLYNYPVSFYIQHNYAAKSLAVNHYLYNPTFYSKLGTYYTQQQHNVLADALTGMFQDDSTVLDQLIINAGIPNTPVIHQMLSQLCHPAETQGGATVMQLIGDVWLGSGGNCTTIRNSLYTYLSQNAGKGLTEIFTALIDSSILVEADVTNFLRRVTADNTLPILDPAIYTKEGPLFGAALLDYSDNQGFAAYVDYLGTQGAAFPINTLFNNLSQEALVTVVYDHDFEELWNFWLQLYYDYTILDYVLLQVLGSDYHTYLQAWNGLYQVSPQFLSQVIRKQKIALTSHTLYGSSRLGVKQYMPGQFYAQWDYTGTVPALDTAFLTQRLPWYSHAQNDVITPTAEDPVGHSDTSIYAVQHQRGMTQYELTNHLGNVQATVSDSRVPNWVGTDSVSYYKPAIAAAYDYYPFGMLMPGRYVQDTSAKCMTISSNKWMTQPVSVCKNASNSWPWYPIVMNSGVNISFSGGMPVLNFYNMSAVLQLHIPKGSSSLTHQRTFSLELLGSVSGVMFALVSQSDSGSFTFFQQQITGSNPVVTMPFVPLGHPNEQIRLLMVSMNPSALFILQQACLTEDEQKLQTVLVDVCNDAGDRYPFGFNGQEKVNEIAGVGNHNTAEFWEYDTRVARRWNLDPIDQISVSNYAAFRNNPILNTDVKGDVVENWNTKSNKPIFTIPGNGGIPSNYKSFIDRENNVAFNKSFIELANTNQVFRRVYGRLANSSTIYRVQQYYQTSISSEAAYNSASKTVKLFYYGASKEAIFEEFLHAGQDDYYKEQGIKRSSLANEVEAKAANLFLGYKDVSADKNDYSSIKSYFRTGEKDKNYDKQVGQLIDEVYDEYSKANGEDWAKENEKGSVDEKTAFQYLESMTTKK